MAVLLLSVAGLSGCASGDKAITWEQEKEGVLRVIQEIKADQSEVSEQQLQQMQQVIAQNQRIAALEKENQSQQAQIDALSTRLLALKNKKPVYKPRQKAKPVVIHRTTELKAPVKVPAPVPTAAEKAARTEAEKNAYTSAYLALKSGRFDEASNAFNKQLDLYPNGEYTDQAWYWLGEARYAQQLLENALHAFKYVADHYPNSVKHAAALLKLGQISQAMKKPDRAVIYYQRLVSEHGDSAVAERARMKLAEIQGGSRSPALESGQ